MVDTIRIPLDSTIRTQSEVDTVYRNRFTIVSSAVKYEDDVYAADDSVIRKRHNAHMYFEDLSTDGSEHVDRTVSGVMPEEQKKEQDS
jgi:hypothetical protein